MALSGGGGLTGGMGMGMAYQAPPPVHTAPSINHGAGMPSIADGLTTEDRAKETLTQTTRIVSFDPVSSSTKNNQVSVVDEDGEFNIKARKGLNLNSLSLRVSDDVVAYKALKKYIKKGSNIAKVIQTCVGKPVDGVPGSKDFITFEDLAKFCTSTNPDGTPPKLSTLTKSPLVELKPLPQPNGNMKYGLAIKIHPTESPIVALPVSENTRDELREMATDIMATSTTKLTHPIPLARLHLFRSSFSSFIKNAHKLASLGGRRKSWDCSSGWPSPP
tara:strand:- start:102 stop:926 length:825 start_codon:yes stop_codon:yes gene_type:complete